VARELRLLQAFVHINVHLERMGDQCVNLAKMVALTGRLEQDPELQAQVEEMGSHARRVASACIHALRSRDVDLAQSLPELDEPVDRLNKGLFKRLAQLAAADDSHLDWAMRMVLVTRYLERLADHAVDVGEYVIFAETGERVELSSNSPQP
jgi:phosphate transport system protein